MSVQVYIEEVGTQEMKEVLIVSLLIVPAELSPRRFLTIRVLSPLQFFSPYLALILIKLPAMHPMSLPSQWTRRPRPVTGDSPPGLVRHHSLAQSSLHIPVVIPLLNLLISIANLPSTSFS